MKFQNIIISGSGKFIPSKIIDHHHFVDHQFYTKDSEPIKNSSLESAQKLESITGIQERRYVQDKLCTSDIAYEAAKLAIADAGISPESIDQIIVAHNFGDVASDSIQADTLPSLACKVKHLLKIENPNCIGYDVIFGCPGWIQGVLQAYASMRAGLSKTCLVIGAETLSRVVDKHDRDSMIYADGAGATIIQLVEEETKRGIISLAAQSYTKEEAFYLYFGKTFKPETGNERCYIKMHGKKIYEFALQKVPAAMKHCFDQSGEEIGNLKKILIHQANEKMDEAIVKRFYRQYKIPVPENIMPISIQSLGNSSVATIPTIYDLIKRNELEGHQINEKDVLLFASVGAGMNINAFTYIV